MGSSIIILQSIISRCEALLLYAKHFIIVTGYRYALLLFNNILIVTTILDTRVIYFLLIYKVG